MSPTEATAGTPPARLRILMVCARYRPFMGGTETHVHEVSRRLVELGHYVTILTTDPTGALPPRDIALGMEIVRVPAWPRHGDLYFAPRLRKHIAEKRWDIVHLQGYHTLVAPMAMWAAWKAGIPYVLSFHSGGHSSRLRNRMRKLQSAALRPFAARAARLVAVSNFEVERFSAELAVSRQCFEVAPNGADIAVSSVPQGEPTRPLIVSVGRLERYKGHHRAIAAMPELLKHIPDAHLRVLGEGPYEADLRAEVRALGLAEHVTIGGIPPDQREGMSQLLASAKLVVLLSEYEAHPVAVMEAISLGRPVLVAATSGLKEIADSGLASAIPLNASPSETAAAIRARITYVPEAGRVRAIQTWDQCVARLSAIYRSVLAADNREPVAA